MNAKVRILNDCLAPMHCKHGHDSGRAEGPYIHAHAPSSVVTCLHSTPKPKASDPLCVHMWQRLIAICLLDYACSSRALGTAQSVAVCFWVVGLAR